MTLHGLALAAAVKLAKVSYVVVKAAVVGAVEVVKHV